MAVNDAFMFFLAFSHQYFSFESHELLFSFVSEVRGEKLPKRIEPAAPSQSDTLPIEIGGWAQPLNSRSLTFKILIKWIFVAFVADNATVSSIRYFENHVSYFVQKPKEVDPIKLISIRQISVSIALK